MRFNLTPDILIETEDELELALESLTASGVDAEWLGILRERATPHLQSPE